MAHSQISPWTRRSVLLAGGTALTTGFFFRHGPAAATRDANPCQAGLGLEQCTALSRKRCLLPPGELQQFSSSLSPSLASGAPSAETTLTAEQLASFDEALKANVLGPLARLFEL